MELSRRHVATLFVVALTTTAGCNAATSALQPGPNGSISDTTATVVDGEPVMEVNYSTGEYAQLLLEAPSGEIIDEQEVSPNSSSTTLALSTRTDGTYRIVMQHGSDTTASQERTFEGPAIEAVETKATWPSGKLGNVSLTVRNTGDLPVEVTDFQYQAAGETRDLVSQSFFVPPGESEPFWLNNSEYSNPISIDEPGTVNGEIQLTTGAGVVSGTFEKTFDGPNLTVQSKTAEWDGNALEYVNVTVANTGDFPALASANIRESGAEHSLQSAHERQIQPGETSTFQLAAAFSDLYRAENGNPVDLSINLNGEHATTSTSITRDGASTHIASVTPNWAGSSLETVTVTVENTGPQSATTSLTLTSAGHQFAQKDVEIPASSTETVTFGDPDSQYRSLIQAYGSGDHTVRIGLEGPTGTDSATTSKAFDGPDPEVVDTTSNVLTYTDPNELNLLDITLANHGDASMMVSKTEIEVGGSTYTDEMLSNVTIAPGDEEQLTFMENAPLDSLPADATVRFYSGDRLVHETTVEVTE